MLYIVSECSCTYYGIEVWRQALKKALAREGMGDMGDPTFEELFEQNERFFTIAQQGPKGDYQENLVSTV
ncbi:hypothetical protein GIB67_008880, partial [Kingdonia uniflora]